MSAWLTYSTSRRCNEIFLLQLLVASIGKNILVIISIVQCLRCRCQVTLCLVMR
jgi:hypothetical protein